LPLREPLGTRISYERRVKGLFQKELAARAGLSLEGLQHIETNRRPNPRIWTVWRIANALGMSVDALLTEEPPIELEELED
jgi:transcriptional regulator with XRE-family HTH domain